MEAMASPSKVYSLLFKLRVRKEDNVVRLGRAAVSFMKRRDPAREQALREGFERYAAETDEPELLKQHWESYVGNRLLYGCSVDEYYIFRFWERTDEEKRNNITEINRFEFYRCNDPSEYTLFADKYELYKSLKPYYGREMMLFDGGNTEELRAFLQKHGDAIVKPYNAYRGLGIRHFKAEDEQQLESCVQEIAADYERAVVEQRVIQTADMASLHEQSLNTVRVTCFRTREGLVIFHPFLRFGRGDNVVDNGGSGGIMAGLDPETGVVCLDGIDEAGHEYTQTPDTGVTLRGFRLPDWEGAVKLAETLMQLHPNTRYVGWDFAHTKDGWIVIEGNSDGQFFGPLPYHTGYRGFRAEAREIMKKM